MSGMTAVANGGAGSAGGISPSNHTAWLEQLESAQWQQRLRYQSNSGQQQGPHDGASTGQREGKLARSAVSMQTGTRTQTGSRASSAMTAPAAQGPAQVITATKVIAGSIRSPEIAVLPPLQQWDVWAGGARYTTMPQHSGWQLRQRPAATWQVHHMHVMQDATGLRVWLRDARYGKGDVDRLLGELRGHFAQLGLRLAQFTLNGAEILKSGELD